MVKPLLALIKPYNSYMEKKYKKDNVIMFRKEAGDMLAKKNYELNTPASSFSVRENTAILYKKDWKQTDKKGKSVYNVTTTGKATISTLELIAEKSNIPAWYLLLPLSEELLFNNDLNDLVMSFINSSPETRQATLHLLKTLNT